MYFYVKYYWSQTDSESCIVKADSSDKVISYMSKWKDKNGPVHWTISEGMPENITIIK